MMDPEAVLAGRAVVITGAGRGLGRAYALHAAQHGAAVVVNDVDPDHAAQTGAEIVAAGGQAVISSHDVSDPAAAEALVTLCRQCFGRIDGLVNNAALYHEAPPWREDPDRLRRMVEVNLLGVMYCGRAATQAMVAQGSGAIVNASSGGLFGFPSTGAYGATKAAVMSLTYAWALDLEEAGVRVNAISPMAATRMTGSSLGRTLVPADRTPDRIAPLVTYLLSDLAAGVTGQFLRFDGERLRVVTHHTFDEHPTAVRDQWDVAGVAAAFDTELAEQLEPYGVERRLPPRRRRPD